MPSADCWAILDPENYESSVTTIPCSQLLRAVKASRKPTVTMQKIIMNELVSFMKRGTRNPLILFTFSQTLSCLWIFLDSDLFLASWPGNWTHLLCPWYHLPEATFDITFKGRVWWLPKSSCKWLSRVSDKICATLKSKILHVGRGLRACECSVCNNKNQILQLAQCRRIFEITITAAACVRATPRVLVSHSRPKGTKF